MHTHVHERAIADAVWDDANAPVCDSGDLRLLLLLIGRINYSCSRVAWCNRSRRHATLFPDAGARRAMLD